jgi:pimeloyl-ACP methyl ester carboxylesterase
MMTQPRGATSDHGTPFYFGGAEKRLFGCHHAPLSRIARSCAVVLCYPCGHEYILAHRACRKLATRLAENGYHVLRFDSYGCGDSAGEDEDGDIRQWLVDISTAVSTLRQKSGIWNVCLTGVRFGATLAMLAAAEQGDVASLVLWDPIVRGADYFEELRVRHRDQLQFFPVILPDEPFDATATELLGFRRPAQFSKGLRGINLLTLRPPSPINVLLVENRREASVDRLRKHLAASDAAVSYHYIPDQQLFTAEAGKLLVPSRTIQSIVDWIPEVHP